jgi:hypothetical protein
VADQTIPESPVRGRGTLVAHLAAGLRRSKPAVARVITVVDQLRGLPDVRESLTADCPQCGLDRVDVLRLTRHRARLACRACGAVVTTGDVGVLRPVAQRRDDRGRNGAAKVAHPADPRAPFMSSLMVEWARATEGGQAGRLDKASIYGLWKNFDRFLSSARDGGDARDRYCDWAQRAGVVDELPEKLPSFGEIVGLLHSHCYQEEPVTAALGGAVDSPAGALAERVRCARRWLAGPGREHCWIDRQVHGEPVDREALRSLTSPGALDGSLAPEQRQALFAAVFGTLGGPPTGALLTRFGPEQLQRSVEAYLVDGSHPLRDLVLRALDGVGDGSPARSELAAVI